jgi:hypothetical protein
VACPVLRVMRGGLIIGGMELLTHSLLRVLAAEAALVPVPVSPDWVPSLLLVLVWLLVAAMVVGPVVRYFRGEPRASQTFSDDPAGPPR